MNQAVDHAFAAPDHLCARSFPIEGTNLARLLADAPYRRAFHARLRRWNPLVVVLYRTGLLSLFGASRTVLLLTTRGRVSGKRRRTPIGYFRIGGVLHLFSAWGKKASWYKNMQANPQEVSIQVGLRRWAVQARALDDPVEIQTTLERFVTESPGQARYLFGWDPGRDRLDRADFSNLIRQVLVVRMEERA
jgi:deazaflavin-dependent oxidoreductase (nitroreductase family)